MSRKVYKVLKLNPEPWAVGTPVTRRGRGGGTFKTITPDPQTEFYQNAVREQFEGDSSLPFDDVELEFYFWRRLDKYTTAAGRKAQKHIADATNMQKALEDALQGIWFVNDRLVHRITSTVVEQTIETTPRILIVASQFEYIEPDLPQDVVNLLYSSDDDALQGSLFDNDASKVF